MRSEKAAALAPLFAYPDATFRRKLEEAARTVPALSAFARAVAEVPLDALQAVYSSTFDLAPSCSPYLGSHLFGDESPERARLMLGLRTRGAGVKELPDHVAEVLAHAYRLEHDEWSELHQLVLVPALRKMDEALRSTSNPYRHLIAAALT